VANNQAVLNRLVGLETEYALRLPSSADGPAIGRYALFQQFLGELRRKTLTAPARHFKEGVFLANGGAAWFETERVASGGGLFEGSTPECRSPRQLLVYQRAQDSLFAAAAAELQGGRVQLLKNDRDAHGNIYGSQENYEVVFARGWRLALWRIWLTLLLPAAAITWMGLWLLTIGIVLYGLIACSVCLALEAVRVRPRWLTRALFGAELEELDATAAGPIWLEQLLDRCARVWTAPLACGLYCGLWVCAFQEQRRAMLPFFVSRAVIGGSGMIDREGKFHLASKGAGINCVLSLGVLGGRGIFACGHFMKPLCADTRWTWSEIFALFHSRQRMQIALGDSNLCEEAEYLRIATTALILDVIDAGELPQLPRLRQPIAALHALADDPTLQATIRVGEHTLTAIELQRFYLDACRRFIDRRPQAPREARSIVRRWETMLDALEHQPKTLVGKLDWVTKQMLLERTSASASWASRKKIDIKYHELSPSGYFQMFDNAGLAFHVLDPEEIERAQRNPPVGTPATIRSHYIREFSGGEEPLRATWRAIYLGKGWRTRRIPLVRGSRSTGAVAGSATSGASPPKQR
jgi:proteasome accessory factor A